MGFSLEKRLTFTKSHLDYPHMKKYKADLLIIITIITAYFILGSKTLSLAILAASSLFLIISLYFFFSEPKENRLSNKEVFKSLTKFEWFSVAVGVILLFLDPVSKAIGVTNLLSQFFVKKVK